MNFTRTPDLKALAYSPWELRPGTTVQVDYSYVATHSETWNSDANVRIVVSGTTWESAVTADWPVDEVVVTPSGLYNIVDITATGHGPIDLAVNYKVEVTENLTAVSAITESSSTYYNDWFVDETGTTVPMTIVPLDLPTNVGIYKPEDFEVTFSQPNRGVATLESDVWTSNSVGTVKMVDHVDDFSMSKNMFRVGKVVVRVPMECTIEPVVRYEVTNGAKTGKYVELDIQSWDPNRIDVRGILWHRDFLYVLTEDGLYAFDRWGDFATPDAHYSDVTGYDLTYAVDDQLLVTEGSTIKVYKVRHDFNHYDRPTETFRMRESAPEFKVEE